MNFPYQIAKESDANDLPVSEAEALEWTNAVDTAGERALLVGLVRAAVAYIETKTQRSLTQTTFEWVGDTWPVGCIAGGFPFVSLTEIQYKDDDDDNWNDLDATKYELIKRGDTYREIKYKTDLPTLKSEVNNRVRLEFVAGYTPTTIPADLKIAVRLLVCEWYDNRGEGKREAPTAVDRILNGYIIHGFA